jgi:hypothetical protein
MSSIQLYFFGGSIITHVRSLRKLSFFADMVRRYGSVVLEMPIPSVRMVSVADKRDIEKVLRYPSRFPFRPPSEIVRRYRLQRPEKYSSGGMAHE